jgi:hypothetical protein
MTYLEDAAAILNKELTAWNHRAIKNAENMRAEILDARLRIADAFARLAAVECEPGDSAVLPHEAEMRIGDALNIAGTFGTTDGAHHKMWVIDQMARMLTGCPTVQKTATDVHGAEYTYDALGESEEYLRFVREAGEWDEGIAP